MLQKSCGDVLADLVAPPLSPPEEEKERASSTAAAADDNDDDDGCPAPVDMRRLLPPLLPTGSAALKLGITVGAGSWTSSCAGSQPSAGGRRW